ncbi:unnamed protein product [Musa acuminata subsp. malaccensis]|uniref:FRIGIDA-like protein n=1 Tax=Musa acuminata subsp. malaccensis TaxID=214687 RepID=A0A804IKT8_MUSAM|nr:unnamed protein product [Musa acuminata subsp. malaccensis]
MGDCQRKGKGEKELISKGHQLDAINFAYEAGLQDKFTPVSLLKSFLKDSNKATSTIEDHNGGGQTTKSMVLILFYCRITRAARNSQLIIRAAIKCIQEHKLEAEFPLESLQKRLEQSEKTKVEKKKPSGGGPAAPANKRTRANNGGPMPPAKAGRLTNTVHVSSPAAPAFVRSPSAHTTYPAAAPYPYDSPAGHGVYGSRSPPVIRDSYGYPAEVGPVALGAPYHSPPMSYPVYGNYNPLGGYNNGVAPGYQQAYYR